MREDTILYQKINASMDQKKELVIRVLEKLEWYREMAPDLLVIVKSSYCTDEIVNSLINMLNKAIKTVKKDSEKKILEKSLQQIQKIRQMEKNEKISDEDLDALLDDID